MELLRDKYILQLIDDLRKKLRVRGIEDNVIPRFIFVCGEQILDDRGQLIDEQILESQNNIRHLIMKSFYKHKNYNDYNEESRPAQCIISEYLYTDDKEIDILTFEEVLAEISECIIIIAESPGTYCELGAFALNDAFVDKMIVINENNPRYKNSFITKGPIKKIKNQNEGNIILYNGKQFLKQSSQFQDMIRAISSQEVKFTPNLNHDKLDLKNMIYEFLNIVELFQPVTAYELEKLYKEIKQIMYYTIINKDKHKINSFKRVIELMLEKRTF